MAVDTESLLIRLEATSEQLRREMRRAEQQIGNSSKRMEREISRVDQSMDRLNKMAATLRRGLLRRAEKNSPAQSVATGRGRPSRGWS